MLGLASLKKDPFEGWFTEGDSKLLLRHFTAIKTDEKEEEEYARNMAEEHARNMLKVIVRSGKDSAYINCWHAGDAESVALWKQYGTEAGAMVIQSTYQKLASAFPDDPEKTVYMGMIKYKNYANPDEHMNFPNDIFNSIPPFFHKRIEYQHEKEVRALIFSPGKVDDDQNENGIKIPVDVDKIIEEIRMRPRTQEWITKVVEKLVKKYDLRLKVLPSQLDEKPMY